MTFNPNERTDLPGPVDVAWRVILVVLELLTQVLIAVVNAAYDLGMILTRDVLKPAVRELKRGRRELRGVRQRRERHNARQQKAADIVRRRALRAQPEGEAV